MTGDSGQGSGRGCDPDTTLAAALERIGRRFPLTPVALDPELARPRSFLKILEARHMNWHAARFRKIFAMRFDVRIPKLEQMNLIMYPEPSFDTPIFLFFCLLTGRKLIGHVNVNLMRGDAAYREKWLAPLVVAKGRHGSFDCEDRYPEWMLKWRTPAGIYGMFPKDRCGDFLRCGLDYLDIYLEQAALAEPLRDDAHLEEVRSSQSRFVSDLRTQDKAQGMMAKMIGAEKARRIFYEITT